MRGASDEIGRYDAEDHLWRATAQDGLPRSLAYTVPQPVVVLGRGSKPDLEVHVERCAADGVPLLRRRGGGCSVVLDPGNLLVAVSLPVEGFGRNLEHFDRLNRRVIAALTRAGIDGVSQAGTSDLVMGERKVGGTCIYRTRGVLHYAASLLVDADLGLIDRYLRHPPREPDYRRGRAHRDFVTNLVDHPGAPDAEAIVAAVTRSFETLEP